MNQRLLTTILITGTGLLGAAGGYLWEHPPASPDDVIGSAHTHPSKTSRVGTHSDRTPQVVHHPPGVDQEFIDWMRTASDPELRAVVLAETDTKNMRGNFRSAALLRELLQRDPQGTFEYFLVHRSGGIFMMDLFALWSSLDPRESTEALVEHAIHHRNPSLGYPARISFEALAREDLQSSLDLAERLAKVGRGHQSAYTGLLAGYAATAPADMEAVMNLVAERGIDPSSAVAPWARADPERAIAWVRRHRNDRPKASTTLVQGISSRDPQRGMELCREFDLLTQSRFGSFAGSTLSKWMKTDYNAALDWIDNNADATPRDFILRRAFGSLQGTDPELVIDRILNGDSAARQHGSLSTALRILGRFAPEDAVLQVLETAPAGKKQEVREALMASGYIVATEDYLTSVLATVDDSFGSLTNPAMRRAVQRQPEKLPEFLAKVPPAHRAHFLESFSSELSRSAPITLLTAVAEMNDPNLYAERGPQKALAELVLSQPELAMATAEAIPEGPGRSTTVETLVANLLPDAPVAALEWLETQRGPGISDERYQKLLQDYRRSHPLQSEQIDAMLERARQSVSE